MLLLVSQVFVQGACSSQWLLKSILSHFFLDKKVRIPTMVITLNPYCSS